MEQQPGEVVTGVVLNQVPNRRIHERIGIMMEPSGCLSSNGSRQGWPGLSTLMPLRRELHPRPKYALVFASLLTRLNIMRPIAIRNRIPSPIRQAPLLTARQPRIIFVCPRDRENLVVVNNSIYVCEVFANGCPLKFNFMHLGDNDSLRDWSIFFFFIIIII